MFLSCSSACRGWWAARSTGRGENAIPSSFCTSQVLQETSQIRMMFPSATFCLWMSKRSDRCVKSHRAKTCPGIIQLRTLKSASYSSINLWTHTKNVTLTHLLLPGVQLPEVIWGWFHAIAVKLTPFLPIKNSNVKRIIFFSFFLIEWVFNRRCKDEQIFLNAKCWWIHSADTLIS